MFQNSTSDKEIQMKLILISIIVFCSIIITPTNCAKKDSNKKKCNCGISNHRYSKNARIFNGNHALDDQYPWQVFLELELLPDSKLKLFGGCLVTMKHILTVAHVFYDEENYDQR